jgi:multicomponent Na+:H+ antiporter subunit G
LRYWPMMVFIEQFVAPLLLIVGSFLCITGAIGMLRFPDFFTRMHATSVTETLGAGLILFALMLLSNGPIEVIKLALVLLFLLCTGPTAVHALAKSALTAGLVPRQSTKRISTETKRELSSKA